MHFFLDFIIAFPSFCPLCPVLLSFIYFTFSFLRLAFFFPFPFFFLMFSLLSFFLHFFLPTYYVYLLSFILLVPSFLSSLPFIYTFKVISKTCQAAFILIFTPRSPKFSGHYASHFTVAPAMLKELNSTNTCYTIETLAKNVSRPTAYLLIRGRSGRCLFL